MKRKISPETVKLAMQQEGVSQADLARGMHERLPNKTFGSLEAWVSRLLASKSSVAVDNEVLSALSGALMKVDTIFDAPPRYVWKRNDQLVLVGVVLPVWEGVEESAYDARDALVKLDANPFKGARLVATDHIQIRKELINERGFPPMNEWGLSSDFASVFWLEPEERQLSALAALHVLFTASLEDGLDAFRSAMDGGTFADIDFTRMARIATHRVRGRRVGDDFTLQFHPPTETDDTPEWREHVADRLIAVAETENEARREDVRRLKVKRS